jgi:hypothetical protein
MLRFLSAIHNVELADAVFGNPADEENGGRCSAASEVPGEKGEVRDRPCSPLSTFLSASHLRPARLLCLRHLGPCGCRDMSFLVATGAVPSA